MMASRLRYSQGLLTGLRKCLKAQRPELSPQGQHHDSMVLIEQVIKVGCHHKCTYAAELNFTCVVLNGLHSGPNEGCKPVLRRFETNFLCGSFLLQNNASSQYPDGHIAAAAQQQTRANRRVCSHEAPICVLVSCSVLSFMEAAGWRPGQFVWRLSSFTFV